MHRLFNFEKKNMETMLWIFQSILAVAFFYSGFSKAFLSKQKALSLGQTGVADISLSQMRFIGFAELLGVLGIIVPWATRIAPVLTPVAAVCFAVIMVLAARIHYQLKEPKNVTTNIFLLILSLLVAYFRFTALK